MSTDAPDTAASVRDANFPPVTPLTVGSLALVVIGAILMAGDFPEPPLTAPAVLLAGSAILWTASMVLLRRQRGFAWPVFFQVARWTLLAYVVIAGMIEFSFVHNHVVGAPLLVLSLLLVMFSLDVALSIASTVGRFAEPTQG